MKIELNHNEVIDIIRGYVQELVPGYTVTDVYGVSYSDTTIILDAPENIERKSILTPAHVVENQVEASPPNFDAAEEALS